MPAISIVGPAANTTLFAYNPILFTTIVTGTNPVVYCDIYFNFAYYKTMVAVNFTGFAGIYQFDIRDACQEFLRSMPSTFVTSAIEGNSASRLIAFVKIRGSALTSGLIVPEGPVPVQGTMDTPASSGGGYQSNTFAVLNGGLQRDEQTPAITFLQQNNHAGGVVGTWPIYNLWRTPTFYVTKDDYLSLPVYTEYQAFDGSDNTPIYVGVKSPVGTVSWFSGPITILDRNMYYVPAGIANFAGLTPIAGSVFDMSTLPYYNIVLRETIAGGGADRWLSGNIYVNKPCKEDKRVRFLNWVGQYETITFAMFGETFKTVAGQWQKYNRQDFGVAGGRSQQGKIRYNVHSNETVSLYGIFTEDQMFLLKQLMASPNAYLEQVQPAPMSSNPNNIAYLDPIVIVDMEYNTRKYDERYTYEVTITAEMSNERINLRN